MYKFVCKQKKNMYTVMAVFKYSVYMCQMRLHTEFQLLLLCSVPEIYTPLLNIITCSTCHQIIQ